MFCSAHFCARIFGVTTVYYPSIQRNSFHQLLWDVATTANYFRKCLTLRRPAHLTPAMKRRVIRKYSRGLNIFVETGTWLGDTVSAMSDKKKVYSVEVQPELYRHAEIRFQGRTNIDLRLGDSAVVLPQILSEIHEPALFWLDGHFPPGIADNCCPTFQELKSVLAHPIKHVILIDDAREFTGQCGTPPFPRLRSMPSVVG